MTTIAVHERSESPQGTTRHGRLEQRALCYPDEVITLNENHGIAFVENCKPIMFRKINYYRRDEINLAPSKSTKSDNLEEYPLVAVFNYWWRVVSKFIGVNR